MYQTYAPIRELSTYIECYWRWTTTAPRPHIEFIMPDAAPELIVHLGAAPAARTEKGRWRRQPGEFLYCAAERCLELRISQAMDVFAIRFRPWGLGAFSRRPMSEMLDRAVPPAESFGRLGQTIVDAVRSAEGNEDRLARLNDLLSKIPATHSNTVNSIELLAESLGADEKPVQLLAEGLARSSRTVRRVWSQVVGISPRAYHKLMRVHRALSQIEKGRRMAEVAADCGFADQAHMARQIKDISGLPPSRLKVWLGQETYHDLYASRQAAPWKRHRQT